MSFSKARLARMHDVLAGHVERDAVPGVVAAVKHGDDIHVEVHGTLAYESDRPVRRDTLFRVSSMTKPVTAAAVMALVEDCVLRLDDPVDRWLPELTDRKVLKRLDGPLEDTVPATRPITVRDLLTFRMGFGQVFAPPDTYPILKAANDLEIGMGPPRPMPKPDEWIRRLGSLPLMHQPGEKWMYNTGADVLGVLIARATGASFEAYLGERLFEPLGMKDTAFNVPEDKIGRLPTSYWSNPATGQLEVYDAPTGDYSRVPDFASGAAGLVSTVDDFLAFGQMLLAKGTLNGTRVLSRASVDLMTTDHLTAEQKAISGLLPGTFDGKGWGFGLSVITRRDDMPSVGTFGWAGGLGTTWSCDPDANLVIVSMTQRAWTSPHPPDICLDFQTLAYQAIDD